MGFSEAWIRDVERLAPESPGGLEPLECAAQALVLSLVRSLGRESSEPARRFLAQANPELLVGVLLATGRYLAHGAFCNATGIEPPVASPLAPVAPTAPASEDTE